MSAFLYERVLLDAEIEAVFADAAIVDAMLRFEVALARVQAKLNLIPAAAAASIETASTTFTLDAEQLARDGAHAGSLAIPFVTALTRHVAHVDTQSAPYVHFGATSQDLLDTALVLCTRAAQAKLEALLARCSAAARALATHHERSAALARTLMQPAGITTFGLKAAHWALALQRCREQLRASATQALALSLGGAVGHLAAFGERGAALRAALATELTLADPGTSWHAQRENWVALAAAAGIAAGAMSKIASDIAFMAQFEVGEAAEPIAAERGGSTAMPHKRNPVLCLRVLAAAQPLPQLVAQLLAAMRQEHERALGNWQAEIAAWPRVFTHTCTTAHALAQLLEGLQVDKQRCQSNIDALHGVLHADRLAVCFAAGLGKEAAQHLCGELAQRALRERTHLAALALQHAASDTRLRQVSASDIEACFSQDTILDACVREVRQMLAMLP